MSYFHNSVDLSLYISSFAQHILPAVSLYKSLGCGEDKPRRNDSNVGPSSRIRQCWCVWLKWLPVGGSPGWSLCSVSTAYFQPSASCSQSSQLGSTLTRTQNIQQMIIFDLERGPVVFTFLFLRNLKSELTSLASHSSRVRREQRRHLQPGLVGLWAGDTRSWWQTWRRADHGSHGEYNNGKRHF